ncbi:MAG: DUF1566 domain-containing protein [Spirochaetia bacterium]|nr:DUF1566 domain-containing protein [Spirochaetia bacterium]
MIIKNNKLILYLFFISILFSGTTCLLETGNPDELNAKEFAETTDNSAVLYLSDTGQSLCASGPLAQGAMLNCDNSEVTVKGQDGHYIDTPAPFNETMSLSGEVINDLTMGLSWQRVSGGQSFTGLTAVETNSPLFTKIEAANYCSSLNTDGLSWRLPEIYELLLLSNYSLTNPAIDTSLFVGPYGSSEEAFYWSNTSFGDMNSWTLNLQTGKNQAVDNNTQQYVKCVSQSLPARQDYQENGDGTISDYASGIIFMKCPAGTIVDYNTTNYCNGEKTLSTWVEALSFCENLNYAGNTNWRLPSIRELSSMIDFSSEAVTSLSKLMFPAAAGSFWSSTTNVNSTSEAWQVNFSTKELSTSLKNTPSNIQCVTNLNN